MSRGAGRKAWPLVLGGLIALAVLARYGGARRRDHSTEEAQDGA